MYRETAMAAVLLAAPAFLSCGPPPIRTRCCDVHVEQSRLHDVPLRWALGQIEAAAKEAELQAGVPLPHRPAVYLYTEPGSFLRTTGMSRRGLTVGRAVHLLCQAETGDCPAALHEMGHFSRPGLAAPWMKEGYATAVELGLFHHPSLHAKACAATCGGTSSSWTTASCADRLSQAWIRVGEIPRARDFKGTDALIAASVVAFHGQDPRGWQRPRIRAWVDFLQRQTSLVGTHSLDPDPAFTMEDRLRQSEDVLKNVRAYPLGSSARIQWLQGAYRSHPAARRILTVCELHERLARGDVLRASALLQTLRQDGCLSAAQGELYEAILQSPLRTNAIRALDEHASIDELVAADGTLAGLTYLRASDPKLEPEHAVTLLRSLASASVGPETRAAAMASLAERDRAKGRFQAAADGFMGAARLTNDPILRLDHERRERACRAASVISPGA